MEITQYLSRLVFAFDKASVLEGNAHRDAFVAAFQEAFQVIRLVLGDEAGRLKEIKSQQPISCGIFRDGKSCSTPAVFWNSIEPVARELYDSSMMRAEIMIVGQQSWKVTVSMDPVYLSLEPV